MTAVARMTRIVTVTSTLTKMIAALIANLATTVKMKLRIAALAAPESKVTTKSRLNKKTVAVKAQPKTGAMKPRRATRIRAALMIPVTMNVRMKSRALITPRVTPQTQLKTGAMKKRRAPPIRAALMILVIKRAALKMIIPGTPKKTKKKKTAVISPTP